MNKEAMRIAVITGGPSQGRFGARVTDWFTGLVRQRAELDVDAIDLAAACLPDAPGGRIGSALPSSVRDLSPWLDAADAFVLVTPERHHGVPGVLKNAIDWFGTEWKAKPVGFCSYAERTGGLHAVQQLRQIFSGLHAVPVRDSVGFHRHPDDDSAPAPAANRPAARMLDQLVWWASALRPARAASPCLL